jgi:hypothetical protein
MLPQKPEQRVHILNLLPGENQWFSPGFFGRPTAPENAIILKLESDLPDWPTFLFTLEEGFMIPWRIEFLKSQGPNKAVVKLNGLNQPDKVAALQGRKWWLPLTGILKNYVQSQQEKSLIGYRFIDLNSGLEGEVVGEEGDEKNPLLRIHCALGEFTVPRYASYIKPRDGKYRRIEAELPDGYLDIFLQ